MVTWAPRIRRIGGFAAAAAAAAVAALGIAAPAHAQAPPPSAVDQYVEMVPAAGGPKTPGKEKEKRTPLPDTGQKALGEAAPEVATPLEEIATSSTYGAPAVIAPTPTPKPEPEGPVRDPDIAPAGTAVDSTLRSTVSTIATASTSDARLVGLLLVVLVTTLAAVGIAFGRTREPVKTRA